MKPNADIDLIKRSVVHWIDIHADRLTKLSEKIWRHAEVGLQEFKTSKYLSEEIENHGFRVERNVAGMPTAFLATWGKGAPVVGFLGELDALAGLSQKSVPRREALEEGAPGHACGHNIHGVSGYAGAVALKSAMEQYGIPGTVKFFGCPAEETLVGKVWLVRDGHFRGVDVVLSHHACSVNTARLSSTNAMNSAKFHFYGKASHAAVDPEQAISASDAVELMNIGANYLREHVIDKARIHYVIEDGGRQPNIVPPYARVWYYVRAPERDQVDQIYKRLLDIADGASRMTGATHKVEFLTACYNVVPNKVLSELVVSNMRQIGTPVYSEEEIAYARTIEQSFDSEKKRELLQEDARPGWENLTNELFDQRVLDPWDEGRVGAGSTDVGDVSWVTPTLEFSSTCWTLGTPAHSWQVTAQTGMSIGHKSLLFASKVIATSMCELVSSPSLLKDVKQEWGSRLKGRTYASPIPADLKPPLNEFKPSGSENGG